MTFKDLKKRIISSNQQQTRLFDICKDKPFWIWDIEEHKRQDVRTNGSCCFNHICGLPAKQKVEKPIFDYEKLLYDSLLANDYSNILNHNFKEERQDER
jgi:hypothetical protein